VILRIWHGWTSEANADAYEELLRTEIIAGIEARDVPGYRGIELGRRSVAGEVEFVTVMRFDTLASVRAFAGSDYEQAVVPPAARALLARFDERSAHYEIAETRPA
jgi:antibiotic biosynthesis monooxygenase (ABM) superfamily enzyme